MNHVIYPEERERLICKRRRRVYLLRLQTGLSGFAKAPWKIIPILLLCGLSMAVWDNRSQIKPFSVDNHLLTAIYNYAVALLIPLVSIVLLAGVLLLLTWPKRAGTYEDCLRQMGLVDRYGNPPALICQNRVKGTEASIMAFYSLGIGREIWEKHSADIQDALNVHFLEPIKYGGRNERNRNIIIITVAPGAEIQRKDVLYDDEI